LADRTDAPELTRKRHQPFVATRAATDPGKARSEDPAAEILFEGTASPGGQRTMLVEKPLVVGVEEQLEVLADR
jgi:hypothetical protein